jgi:hypothetical protein
MKNLSITLFLLLTSVVPSRAEFLQMDITIFGMD